MTPEFATEDRRAVDAIARKRDDLARARKVSLSLVAPLESEIATCTASLEKARLAAAEYEREYFALAQVEARRKAAIAVANTSHEVELDAAARIVQDASVAQYLESAYRRRAEAARSAASSAFFRAAKDISDRGAAVRFAELVAAAVVNCAVLPSETRPSVLAWARLTLPAEGRAAYLREFAVRENHPSFVCPRLVEDFDSEVEHFWAGIARAREKAARQAAELDALDLSEAAEAPEIDAAE